MGARFTEMEIYRTFFLTMYLLLLFFNSYIVLFLVKDTPMNELLLFYFVNHLLINRLQGVLAHCLYSEILNK